MVLALLEWDDPSVQEIPDRDPLSSQVVDYEHPAGGLELWRRLVHPPRRVPLEVELVQCELSPCDDDRSPRWHVPAIMIGNRAEDLARHARALVLVGARRLLLVRQPESVVHGIVDDHDATVDEHAVGHEVLVAEDSRDALGQQRLAVSGSSVQEQRSSGVDGGPE